MGERLVIRLVRIGAAIGALGLGVLLGGATAGADPAAPGCSAGDFERLKSQVASATADYMFSHPDVNDFFSGLRGQPKEQSRDKVRDYFAANPQVKAELGQIRQPLRDMRARCQ